MNLSAYRLGLSIMKTGFRTCIRLLRGRECDLRRYADLIGNTPLVRLAHSGFSDGLRIYAKLELYNPSGSVKDRIGKYMIEDAERRGILKPGSTIVEATAGNTGLGIAFAALNKGYRLIFVVPTKFSQEKQTLLRALVCRNHRK